MWPLLQRAPWRRRRSSTGALPPFSLLPALGCQGGWWVLRLWLVPSPWFSALSGAETCTDQEDLLVGHNDEERFLRAEKLQQVYS